VPWIASATDPEAESADPDQPAFLARPAGAPVYRGFPILDDVEVDGFRLGMISDWETEPSEYGDAFLVAPDNSRCGLIWEVTDAPYVTPESRVPEDETRWGVWNVGFPNPMNSRENARRNISCVLDDLRPKWERWRADDRRSRSEETSGA
jgi:hypothetical protein